MNLLLAAVLLMQDKIAEETFKDIEGTLQKAKSISVKAEAEVKWIAKPANNRSVEATLMRADGNKVFEYEKIVQNGVVFDGELRSDGTQVWRGLMGKLDMEPKVARADFDAKLARIGPGLSTVFIVGKELKKPEGVNDSLIVSDLKHADDDGASKTLTYTLSFAGRLKGVSVEIKLWYDPASLKLLRRGAVISDKGVLQGTVNEKYTEFLTNTDIPDEKFKLPEEKK